MTAAVATAYSGLGLDEDTLEYMGSLVGAEEWAGAAQLQAALADFVDAEDAAQRALACFAALPAACLPAFAPPARVAPVSAADFAAAPEAEPSVAQPTKPSKAQRRREHKAQPKPGRPCAQGEAPAPSLAALAALGTDATAQSLFDGDGDDAERWAAAQAQGRSWGGAKFGGRGLAFRRSDRTMMTLDVRLSLVTEFGQRDLVTQSELKLQAGHRYALVGKNGTGKTTLLRQLYKRALPGMPEVRCGYVCQELVGSDRTALELLLAQDDTAVLEAERDALQDDLDDADKAQRFADLCELLEERTDREAGAKRQLRRLGFSAAQMQQPTAELSGGWRMRCALACALAGAPDLLLLDEPTNHLDLKGVLWLEQFLVSVPGIVVVVSHDRAFLDAVSTDVIELRQLRLNQGAGSYGRWREARDEEARGIVQRLEVAEKQREKIKKEIQQTKQQATSKKGCDDNKLRQMRQRETKLLGRRGDSRLRGTSWERKSVGLIGAEAADGGAFKRGAAVTAQNMAVDVAAKAAALAADAVLKLKLPSGAPGHGVLLGLDGLPVGLPGRAPLLPCVRLTLDGRVRVAVVGPNGAGKTTLLRCLGGELWPEGGVRQPRLRCATLSQHHLEAMERVLDLSCLEYVREQLGTGSLPDQKAAGAPSDQDLRQYLGSVGLGAVARQRLSTLSGGQRCRLCLAASCANSPHVLLLDEPTNHLDLDSSAALAAEVGTFAGAVVIVSHDRHFLQNLATDLWIVDKGRVTTSADFPNAFAEYARRCA